MISDPILFSTSLLIKKNGRSRRKENFEEQTIVIGSGVSRKNRRIITPIFQYGAESGSAGSLMKLDEGKSVLVFTHALTVLLKET